MKIAAFVTLLTVLFTSAVSAFEKQFGAWEGQEIMGERVIKVEGAKSEIYLFTLEGNLFMSVDVNDRDCEAEGVGNGESYTMPLRFNDRLIKGEFYCYDDGGYSYPTYEVQSPMYKARIIEELKWSTVAVLSQMDGKVYDTYSAMGFSKAYRWLRK